MPNKNEQSNLANSNTSPSGNNWTSSGIITTTEQMSNYINKGFGVSDVSEFLKVIEGIVKETINKVSPKVLFAKIIKRNDDYHYDIEVLSGDKSGIIHNVLNMTRFDYKAGDYVEIMNTQNNLSTAYISCARSLPPVSATNTTGTM